MDASSKSIYLLCYDVRDPSRLRRVHRVALGFGDAVQLSVFRCELSPRELVKLREKLREIVTSEDQILFADLGPVDGRGSSSISVLGSPGDKPQRSAIVV